MIIDDVIIEVRAGKGGDGSVSFRKEKFVPRGGPDGGNGGKGGSVYFIAVSDLSALKQFRHKKHVHALSGEGGKGKKMHGKNADDVLVYIPVGTSIRNVIGDEFYQLSRVGEKVLIARGGRGGRGNFEFRSSTNRAPDTAEKGTPGEEKNLHLNLQFIADVGLIGLPSAGKSSLLNVLTKAEVKVGDYPFTTLEANLGTLHDIILADIPGLIEGAHQGRGLGIKFLKHVEKTRLLLHCIDVTSQSIREDYETIRNELGMFNKELLEKDEIIVLTKIDLVSSSDVEKAKKSLARVGNPIIEVSIIDDKKIKQLKDMLGKHSF